MSERFFRLILGVSLMIFLYFEMLYAEYVYIGVLMFEAVTNWRFPLLVSKLRYGNQYLNHVDEGNLSAKFPFEAERMLRLVVVVFVALSFIYPEVLWWLSWFAGFMLMLAGITSICPMVMFFRWAGFR